MSEYWKSNPKKFCDYCKIWIQDNKASIRIHESGRNHKEKVNQKLEEIKKKADQKKHEEKIYNKSMAAIEKAAMEAMQNDLESNPSLRKQYGSASKSNFLSSDASTPSETKKKVTVVKQVVPKKNESATKRKLTNEPEAKIGKWETVENKKPHFEPKPVHIDLQLPSKTTDKKLISGLDDLQNEQQEIEEKKEPLSKWVTVGFTPIDNESQEIEKKLKEEPPTEENNPETESLSAKEEKIEIEIKKEPEQLIKEEKIPTIKLSNRKKEKAIVFKKRNKEVSLRGRTDE